MALLKVTGALAEDGPLRLLIERYVGKRFRVRPLPFNRYLPFTAVKQYLPYPQIEYLQHSQRVHAVKFKGEILIHPDTLAKWIARRVERQIKEILKKSPQREVYSEPLFRPGYQRTNLALRPEVPVAPLPNGRADS